MKRLHPVVGALALATILVFWLSTVVAEVFASPEGIVTVKRLIPYGFLVLIPALALTGASGLRIGANWRHPLVAAKKKRMPFIALNGVLILIPSAFVLRHLALAGDFGALFYTVQMVELAAGAVNIGLLSLNMRDGLRLRRR